MKRNLPTILELGLREWNAVEQKGYEGTAEVVEFLAGLPDPQDILALRPSHTLQQRIHDLLEKNRTTGLTEQEEEEWEHYQYVEHLVRIAKAKACGRLKKSE